MTYIAGDDSAGGVAKVIYDSKDGKTSNTFDALDWLARLVTHIPNKGESACGGSDIMAITQISPVVYEKRLCDYQDNSGIACLYPVHPVDPVKNGKSIAVTFFIRSNEPLRG
jgi:hypothetical protein